MSLPCGVTNDSTVSNYRLLYDIVIIVQYHPKLGKVSCEANEIGNSFGFRTKSKGISNFIGFATTSYRCVHDRMRIDVSRHHFVGAEVLILNAQWNRHVQQHRIRHRIGQKSQQVHTSHDSTTGTHGYSRALCVSVKFSMTSCSHEDRVEIGRKISVVVTEHDISCPRSNISNRIIRHFLHVLHDSVKSLRLVRLRDDQSSGRFVPEIVWNSHTA